jgi:O-antigen/teichoic acid export membrane protein
MNLSKSVFKLSSAQVVVQIIGFLAPAIFANILSPTHLGIFITFQAFIGILGIPTTAAIAPVVEKRLSKGNRLVSAV